MTNVYIGFGNPGTPDFARFSVLADRSSGVYPDWQAPLHQVVDQIVGSSNFEVQFTGFGPARVTLHLMFDSAAEFRHLQTLLGKKRTLVLYAGFARHEGVVHHWDGRAYEYFANTVLADVSGAQHQPGGIVECSATFIRSSVGMGVTL